MDADETVINNSQYQKEQRNQYNSETWRKWCKREEAKALPGVIDFLKLVHKRKGKIAIVSNRKVNVQEATERNFHKEEIPFDVMLLRKEDEEKESRWKKIENGSASPTLPALKIIMYFGDNITDFPDLDQHQRRQPAKDFSLFGTRYFMLPNPVYGSFVDNSRN